MLQFYKYHGAGNDFIILNNLDGKISLSREQIIFLCDRHKGIGADGVILAEKSGEADSAGSPQADCFMNYYNQDGKPAEMCGNGIRCLVKFLQDNVWKGKTDFKIATRAGIKEIKSEADSTFSVNMGAPVFSGPDFPDKPLLLEGLEFNFVSMGNPHAVALVKNLDRYDISALGPKIENNKIFPNKINVELVEKVKEDYFKVNPGTLPRGMQSARVKVWERGSGATLSCGSGASAVYAILTRASARTSARKDLAESEVTLEFPGGKLYLSQNPKGEIILRGPAVFVFQGEVKVK